MPRNRRFGFITKEQVAMRTVAHELGHGAFNLKHTFPEVPQGSTKNLMDYSDGLALYKPQWDLIHNPEFTTGLWDGMEDGAVINRVAAIIEAIRSSKGKTPGSTIEIPWYGGNSTMSGYVTIGVEKVDCDISLKGQVEISNNTIKFTVPDLQTYVTASGSASIERYYTLNVNIINFKELKLETTSLTGDIIFKEKQAAKILNYISEGVESNISILDKISKCNTKYIIDKTDNEKESTIEELLNYDIEPRYYTELSLPLRIASIKHIVNHKHVFQNVTDTEEQEIIYLIDNIKDSEINTFLTLLETEMSGDYSIAITLLKDFQDAALPTVTGTRDYYTSLIQVFIRLVQKDTKRIAELSGYKPENTIKLGDISWWKSKIEGSFSYSTECTGTSIKIQESCFLPITVTNDAPSYGIVGTSRTTYGWLKNKQSLDVNPFSLVVLDQRSDVSFDILRRIYDGEQISDGIRAIPAAALDYVNHKKDNKTYADLTYLSFDVLSMAVGVGELSIAYKVLSNSRKILVALDVLNSGTNFLVNTTELQEDATIKKWLDLYNTTTLFTNLASTYKGGSNIIGKVATGADYLSYLKNKGFTVFEEIEDVVFVRDAGNKVGKVLDKTKLDEISWFTPKTGNTWPIHETNVTDYLKFKYGNKVSTQVKIRTYHSNGQFVDGYLDDLVETSNRDLLIIDAKHSQKAQIVDGKTPGYTSGQTQTYQWITDGDAVKIEIIGDGAVQNGLPRGTDILQRLKGKVGIITNDASGQMVEMSVYKTTK